VIWRSAMHVRSLVRLTRNEGTTGASHPFFQVA